MLIHLDKYMGAGMVASFKRGDEKAFKIIFDACYRLLCFYAENIIQDKQGSKDIVQECFEKLWERRSNFESAEHIEGFLCLSVTNKCIDHIRTAGRRARHEQDILLATDMENDMLRSVFQLDRVQRVREEIESLPPQCRKIMRMSYVEGMTIEQIAAELNLSRHTVRNQRARGRELLKPRLRNIFLEICAFLATIFSITKS
jgi:RNA polymerase sigma-70 factor (family 1)